jgi:hypothetical protein
MMLNLGIWQTFLGVAVRRRCEKCGVTCMAPSILRMACCCSPTLGGRFQLKSEELLNLEIFLKLQLTLSSLPGVLLT